MLLCTLRTEQFCRNTCAHVQRAVGIECIAMSSVIADRIAVKCIYTLFQIQKPPVSTGSCMHCYGMRNARRHKPSRWHLHIALIEFISDNWFERRGHTVLRAMAVSRVATYLTVARVTSCGSRVATFNGCILSANVNLLQTIDCNDMFLFHFSFFHFVHGLQILVGILEIINLITLL